MQKFKQGLELWGLQVRQGGENGYLGTFSHSNTANRAYTLPDKNGTIAMLSDVNPVISSSSVITALGYTPANKAGDIFTGPVTAKGFISNPVILDLTALDTATWYPVTVYLPAWRTIRMRVEAALDMGVVPSWSTHAAGYSVICDWSSNGAGWGTQSISRIINTNVQLFSNIQIVGGIGQLSNSSTEFIYLRGGGKYRFESDYPVTPIIRSTTYTINGESVSPTTSVYNNIWSAANCAISFGDIRSYGTISGSGAGLTGIAPSLTAGAVSSITANTGLISNRLTPVGAIDSLTTANFRTKLFGSATGGGAISAARWNNPPSIIGGLSVYGTMIAWGAADTHGFLAVNYNGAGAKIGGGNADVINWTADLITSANINLQTVANANALGTLSVNQIAAYQSIRDFTNGTLIQTSIDYSVTNGDAWFLEIIGNSYGGIPPFDSSFQGYIYNNSMISVSGLQKGSIITGIVAINYNGYLCFWFPRMGYWQGFTAFVSRVSSGTGARCNLVTAIVDSVKPSSATKEVALPYTTSITSANIGSQTVANAGNASTVTTLNTNQVFNAIASSNNTDWYRTVGACGVYFSSYATGLWATSAQWLETYNNGSLKVNGELRVTSNIIAYYSDARLKENIKVIPNALDKVLALRGVTFNANSAALEVGYTDISEQAGVIAQEVQKVLPQAVKFAPFDQEMSEDSKTSTSKSGKNYLTVQYERIIPLLIEAIKELNQKVDNLI